MVLSSVRLCTTAVSDESGANTIIVAPVPNTTTKPKN